jgi:aminoglycoside phosphotransferase (APT) family kinase protein
MWAADIDVDAELARRLIAAQFPDLRGASVEPAGSGWDNAAFLVDGELLFRFPRRRIAAPLIERELALLPSIAPRVPLPISVPAFAGVPAEAYPWSFAGYRKIAGVTACALALADAERAALAEPLGAFLRALHGIDPAPLVARGLPPDELGWLDHAKRLGVSRERLPVLSAAGAEVVDRARELVDWLAANPPGRVPESGRAVVHGDLYARHVILCDGALAGIIDWGDVHHGDPALDLAIAHLMLPQFAHARFRAAYGPIDDRTWSAARYRAIYHAILELDYGIRTGDAGMRDIGAAALRSMRGAAHDD